MWSLELNVLPHWLFFLPTVFRSVRKLNRDNFCKPLALNGFTDSKRMLGRVAFIK